MKELTISEKTELTQELTDNRFFYEDLELFKSKFPYSKLNTELTRVNEYNQKRLQGQIIYNLLDVVSKKEINANRKKKEAKLKVATETEKQVDATTETENQDTETEETQQTDVQETETQVDATAETEETQQIDVQKTETQKPASVEKKTTQKGQSKKSSQK